MEKVYELICEEQEYNPLVGTAVTETRAFLRKLGYSDGASSVVLHRIERIYDLNLYRRPNDSARKEIGEVIEQEFGVTRTYKSSVYSKIANLYRRRLKAGMTREEAIKACHEHYDPILAKERAGEPQTADVAMVIPKSLSAELRHQDLSDLEIEI